MEWAKLKLGDIVAKATKKMKIPQCQKCKERQTKLNNIDISVPKLGAKFNNG